MVGAGVQRGIEAEEVRERSDEVNEVGGGEDPRAEVGGGILADEPGGIYEGVTRLHEHVAGGGEVDGRGASGVGLEEPNGGREVVHGAAEGDRDGSLRLKEMGGTAVVMGEGGCARAEGGEGLRQRHQVLPYMPLHVLRVGQRRRPPLRQGRRQELLHVLGGRRRRRRRMRGHRQRGTSADRALFFFFLGRRGFLTLGRSVVNRLFLPRLFPLLLRELADRIEIVSESESYHNSNVVLR